MSCRPIQGKQSSPAKTFQYYLWTESLFSGKKAVKFIHPVQRAGRPVHIGNINISHVKPFCGQYTVCLGLMAEEFRPPDPGVPRSEEHTSELQSLMRISY